jgi:multidrug resistance protein
LVDGERNILHPSTVCYTDSLLQKKKFLVVLVGILTVVNSTIGSSLPSGAINFIAEYWSITSPQQLVLPISIFLIGYVVGPLAFGPLSETYGRRPIMLYTFLVYCGFTLGCALAPTWPLFLVFRLICGVMASAPITVVGGLYADIFHDPRTRGRAMAYFMAATTFGPVMGPFISGFLSTISWRWTFWFGLILAGITLPFLIALPETYLPVLLHRKATKLREETGNQELVALCELEKKGARHMVTVVLTRPFRMIIYESIVLFSCLYLSLAYAIFYMYFQAYPIIFQGPESRSLSTPNGLL